MNPRRPILNVFNVIAGVSSIVGLALYLLT